MDVLLAELGVSELTAIAGVILVIFGGTITWMTRIAASLARVENTVEHLAKQQGIRTNESARRSDQINVRVSAIEAKLHELDTALAVIKTAK